MSVRRSSSYLQVLFDHSIKSIVPGHDRDLLLLETLSTNHQQTFSLISIERQEVIKTFSPGPDYAGSVAKSYSRDQLVLAQYTPQNNPDQTHVFVFDWLKKAPLFHFENTKIIQASPGWIQLPHPHFTHKSIFIDMNTGLEMRNDPSPDRNSTPSIRYATAYPSTSEYFQWFEQYFSTHHIVPCRQIEYLKINDRVLISFYEEQNGGLKNTLAILDTKGQLLEHILLEEKLKGVGKDTFFVLDHHALFVTSKNTLNIYAL